MLTNKQIKEIGLEIWQINDIETWIGYGLSDIKKVAIEQTGCSPDELFNDIVKIPIETWDSMLITEQDEKYMPIYTYRNYVEKIINENPNQEFPFCFASTEF